MAPTFVFYCKLYTPRILLQISDIMYNVHGVSQGLRITSRIGTPFVSHVRMMIQTDKKHEVEEKNQLSHLFYFFSFSIEMLGLNELRSTLNHK